MVGVTNMAPMIQVSTVATAVIVSFRCVPVEVCDALPNLILELDHRGARQYLGRRGRFLAVLDKTHHPDSAISEVAVAAAVSPEQCRAKSHYLITGADHSRC